MTDVPEFSRPFALDRLGAAAVSETVTATADECAALARRLGIPAVRKLTCRWRLHRGQAGRIEAEGRIAARLVRECVITLEEFATDANEDFRIAFVPCGRESDDPDPEAVDEVPYDGVALDLGETAAEQLALSLDPYPHKSGATLPDVEEPTQGESPFAALARRMKDG
jgi:hypothetical protein